LFAIGQREKSRNCLNMKNWMVVSEGG
jgi:hypothetical protein